MKFKRINKITKYLRVFGQESNPLTTEGAKKLGEKIGIDWDIVDFDVDQFIKGYEVELEHGAHDPETNVSEDDPEITAKIAWAHLKELPDYYDRLAKMEKNG